MSLAVDWQALAFFDLQKHTDYCISMKIHIKNFQYLNCITIYIFKIDIPSTNHLLNIIRTIGVAFQAIDIYLGISVCIYNAFSKCLS